MTLTNKLVLKLAGAATGMVLAAASSVALASGKPVALMVPFPPGGPADATARVFTEPLSRELGTTVIVENLGGVAGALAAQKVLAAPADGRYLFQGSPNAVITSPLVNSAVTFKSQDFRLVHPMAEAVMVFITRNDLPVNSVDELIELARNSPEGSLNYGSVGVGSLYHMIMEDIQKQTDIKFTHVPYKGNTPVLQDLGGGQIDLALLVYNSSMGAMAEQGRIKVIGQLNEKRSELLPNVPSASEGKALKTVDYSVWSGFMVPKNTPEGVVERLHKAITASLKDPTVREQMAAQTQMAAQPMSLEDAASFFESETARYRAIAGSINLTPQ